MNDIKDRIEKKTFLRAPLARVWHAISDAKAFGTWFGVDFDGPFVAGARLTGRIVPTQVDAEVARMQEPYRGAPFECTIDRIEPLRLFSFFWHPFSGNPSLDLSSEPSTRVVFELEEAEGGTNLTITESGFNRIPLERRVKAFNGNEQGWNAQLKLIEKYLTDPSHV